MINVVFFRNSFEKLLKEKDFSFISLVICLFLLPLSINFSTFFLISSLVLKIIQVLFLKHKLFALKSLKISSLIGFLFFFYVVVNSIFQTNINYFLNVFDKEFSHLALFFLAPILLKKKGDNIVLIQSLLLGLITALFYVFIFSFVSKIAFDKVAFLNLLNIHHTYLSIYILFFVNILLVSISSKKNNTKELITTILLLIVVFVILFLLGSKVSIVIFLMFIGIYILLFFSGKKGVNFLIFCPIIIVCFLVFNSKIDTSYKSALNFRSEIWIEATNSIQENLFFGNLKMSEKDILNFQHYKSGKYYLMDSDLNSHNQYLSLLLKYGVVGVAVLSFFLLNFFLTKNVSTSKNTIKSFIGFSMILFFTYYIENVLDRHHGIVFVVIFYNFYLAAIENEKA